MSVAVLLLIILIALLGTPLFIVIGATAVYNFFSTPGSGGILNVIIEITGIAQMPLLHSIPLFAFAGYVLARSNASKRLVNLTKAILGWMPGGLAIVTILACSLFTAFSGASGVTIVALGGLLLSALLSEKYGEKYSLGLITSSGSFGLLFPPSLPIIIFGVVAGAGAKGGAGSVVNIGDLFIAGFIPGLLITIVLSIHAIAMSRKYKIARTKFSFKDIGDALWDAKWEAPLPFLLFLGIFSGKLVISDAAVITVVYILIVEIFLTKDVKIKDIPKIMKESMMLVGAILIILSISLAATNYIIYQQIPQKLFEFIKTFISNKLLFFILLNIFLLIVGCLMDIYSAMVVIVPLILPIAEAYNINLLHLGIVFIANLQIGYITPPVGMDLFIASLRFNKSIITLAKSALIFIGLLLGCLLIITYVPALSIWFKEKPSIVGSWEYKFANGDIDKIVIKSNGKYIRQQYNPKNLDVILPYYGDYYIKNDILVLKTDAGEKKYKYEIYNNGVRLFIEYLDKKEISSHIKSNKSDSGSDNWWDEEDSPSTTVSKDETEGKLFYKNNLTTPVGRYSEELYAKWEDKTTNSTIEFNLNGTVNWTINNELKNYGFRVKSKNNIELIDFNEKDINKRIKKFNFKFIDTSHLIIIDKKDKTIKYNFEFIDSTNEY